MRATLKTVTFEALDGCHQQIQVQLAALTALAAHIQAVGFDALAQQQAADIEVFFSTTSQQHHVDEERNVFPALLASGDADMVEKVCTLQQDHGWIEENWIELAPQLRAIAGGNGWADTAEFLHGVEVFVGLCSSHIQLEETVIYPAAKAMKMQSAAAIQA